MLPLGVFLFLFLWLQGAFLGLSDDEAYYWVLSQKPALGYAFHPPGVAWLISLTKITFGGIFGEYSAAMVRFPAALSSALIFALSLRWIKVVSGTEVGPVQIRRAAWILLSFSGFFSLSWMIVPDIPLFLGWTLSFVSTWKICFEEKADIKSYLILGLGLIFSFLAKHSAILIFFSVFLAIFLWAPVQQKRKGFLALFLGALVGVAPTLIWNAQNHWVSLLYQIRDRHGGSFSWIRYLRFWLIQLILAGPLSVGFTFYVLKKRNRVLQYCSIWILPAMFVFCIQPFFSDFKAHWALIVWWPGVLALAWSALEDRTWRWARVQAFYGSFLGILVFLSCHFPIVGWSTKVMATSFDPRWDATNDLYGWQGFREFYKKTAEQQRGFFPVVGSWYQTASQAAFSLGKMAQVTLLPRSERERGDWLDLGISDGLGPDWPRLNQPIYFVSDNRYDSGPSFPNANCSKLGRFEERRFNLPAKWIQLWFCQPQINLK